MPPLNTSTHNYIPSSHFPLSCCTQTGFIFWPFSTLCYSPLIKKDGIFFFLLLWATGTWFMEAVVKLLLLPKFYHVDKWKQTNPGLIVTSKKLLTSWLRRRMWTENSVVVSCVCVYFFYVHWGQVTFPPWVSVLSLVKLESS